MILSPISGVTFVSRFFSSPEGVLGIIWQGEKCLLSDLYRVHILTGPGPVKKCTLYDCIHGQAQDLSQGLWEEVFEEG